MKISFEIAAFAEAAKALRQIPSSAARVDILDHARLEVGAGQMSLTMSDLDMEGRATIDCEADGEGLYTLPRAVLEFFVARADMQPARATLEIDDSRQSVGRHGAARITMPTLPGSDFPTLDIGRTEWAFKVRAHALCRAFRRTEKAVPTDESRIQMQGVFVHAQPDGSLAAIGSDGNRLHLVDLPVEETSGELPCPSGAPAPGVMIPTRATREIQRMFSADESLIDLSGTDGLVVVSGERLRIVSKLYDAVYYDWRRAPQPSGESAVTIPADRLARAVELLLVVPKTVAKGKRVPGTVSFHVTETGGRLTTRGDLGDAEDVIDFDKRTADPGASIHFHPPYLRDALDAVDAKMVTIHLPEKFGMPFRIVGAEGDGSFLVGQRKPDFRDMGAQ